MWNSGSVVYIAIIVGVGGGVGNSGGERPTLLVK